MFNLNSHIRMVMTALMSSLAIGSMALPARSDIFGADDRIIPSYNWMLSTQRQAIGRLEIKTASGEYATCTFTVIGRNIGLTNAHCLLDAAGRGPRQVKAFALQYGNQVYASANVDLYWAGLRKAAVSLNDLARDWAVIRFTTNLGDVTGWFGNEAYLSNLKNAGSSVVFSSTNLIGYSGGGTIPTAHLGCTHYGKVDNLLVHTCDSLPGSSGASLHTTSTRRIQSLNRGNFGSYNTSVPLEMFMPAVQRLRATGAASSTSVPVP